MIKITMISSKIMPQSYLNREFVKCIFCMLFIGLCFDIKADTIDADKILLDRYKNKIPNRNLKVDDILKSNKADFKNAMLVISRDRLMIRNLRMISNNIYFSDVKRSPLPEQVEVRKSTFVNCTNSAKTEEVVISIEVREVSSVNITKSITTSSKTGFDIALPLEKLSKFTGSFEKTTNITDLKSQTNENKRSETRKESITKPAMTKYIIELRADYRKDALLFSGNIIADGEIYTAGDGGKELSFGLASQSLTPQERTFDISGEIWNVSANEVIQTYTDVPLTEKSEECAKAY